MKRLVVMVCTFVLTCGSIAYAQKYTRNGNEFRQMATNSQQVIKTDYTWKASDGKSYPIYLSSKGRAYIIKTSKKTGKEYKVYLPKTIEKEIKQ